jgi:hypothetical protein
MTGRVSQRFGQTYRLDLELDISDTNSLRYPEGDELSSVLTTWSYFRSDTLSGIKLTPLPCRRRSQ